jgi:GMP synthase-like glutamine amidotransferase
MPRVLFIAHDHVSAPAIVGERFVDRGWDIKVFQIVSAERSESPNVEVDLPDPQDFDAIVPLGAPWSVYDPAVDSWVERELAMLRSADEAGVPVLGICFGGQLLAAAHGGSVSRSPAPELGWHVIQTDDSSMISTGPWFQWHGDRWELPPGSKELARNAAASQAFVLRRNLAVQFHPELDVPTLDMWLGNAGSAQVAGHGLNESVLRSHTSTETPAARMRTYVLVDAFLDRVAVA